MYNPADRVIHGQKYSEVYNHSDYIIPVLITELYSNMFFLITEL